MKSISPSALCYAEGRITDKTGTQLNCLIPQAAVIPCVAGASCCVSRLVERNKSMYFVSFFNILLVSFLLSLHRSMLRRHKDTSATFHLCACYQINQAVLQC